jgi:hypothetical protein
LETKRSGACRIAVGYRRNMQSEEWKRWRAPDGTHLLLWVEDLGFMSGRNRRFLHFESQGGESLGATPVPESFAIGMATSAELQELWLLAMR